MVASACVDIWAVSKRERTDQGAYQSCDAACTAYPASLWRNEGSNGGGACAGSRGTGTAAALVAELCTSVDSNLDKQEDGRGAKLGPSGEYAEGVGVGVSMARRGAPGGEEQVNHKALSS